MNRLKTAAILALAFAAITTNAQEKFIAGGRVGLGLSTLAPLNESKPLVHFAFGGTATYSFLPFLGLSADALFVTSGSAYSGTRIIKDPQGFTNEEPYEGEIRFTSLSIPVYPGLSFGNEDTRVILNGGVATNFNLFAFESRDYENDNSNENVKDQVKELLSDYQAVTFAALYGAGMRFKISAEEYLRVDLRATMGLNEIYTTVNNEDPSSVKRNLYSVNVTYYF